MSIVMTVHSNQIKLKLLRSSLRSPFRTFLLYVNMSNVYHDSPIKIKSKSSKTKSPPQNPSHQFHVSDLG